MSATLASPQAGTEVPVPLWMRVVRNHKVLFIALVLFVLLSIVRAWRGADDLTSSKTVGSTLRFTIPILLAGLAGLWAERVGVVNIGIEGMMIFGTWFGGVGAWKFGPWVGLLLAIVGGMVGGLIHSVATVTFNVNHIISGVAINLFALYGMRYLSELWWSGSDAPQGAGITQSPQQRRPPTRFDFPFLSGGKIGSWKSPDMLGWLEKRGWPVIGDIAGVLRGFTHNVHVITLLALATVPLTSFVLWRTKFGLRVRSSGEAPAAAESLGVRVLPLRYTALLVSGACAGFGGGYLSIVASSYYRQGQTANKGFIGLATMIAGNWRPTGVLSSGFLFGYPQGLNLVGRDALLDLFIFGAIVCLAWAIFSVIRARWVQFGLAVVLGSMLYIWWDGIPLVDDIWFVHDSWEVTRIPESLTGGIPYLLTIIVLAVASQRLRPPEHAGQPYRPGESR
jgi:simple sugar transport system permease protein